MDAFDQFWASYPRREAKKDAKKAWAQAHGDKHIDAILSALAWQRRTDSWVRGFVPYAATYLRGERWEDENPQVVRCIVTTLAEADAAAARKAEADRQNAINEQRERQWREAQERRRA